MQIGRFCNSRGIKPFSHCYFAVPLNQNEQFMNFVGLTKWLIGITGGKTSGWNEYDDPNTVTNNIVVDLKKLGIPVNFAANKLKTGSGDSVC